MERISFSVKLAAPLTQGSQGDLVWLVQAMLSALSHRFINLTCPAMTGTYDAQTSAAIARIQRAWGLEDTGNLDRETFQRLAELFCCWQSST